MILLNGWGAYILALVSNYQTEQSAFEILWGTLPYNIYAWLTLLVVAYTIISDKVHGPMKQAEIELETTESSLSAAPATKSRFMLLPLAVMIFGMVGFMFWTGNGELSKGSGSRSVLYSTFLAVIVAYLQLLWHKRFDHSW